MSDAELAAIPVEKDEREQRWARLGIEFEDRIVRALCDSETVLLPGKEGYLSERRSIGFLRGEVADRYAAQVILQPKNPPAVLASVGVDFRRTFPDLIRVDRIGQKPFFTVIDIKATRHATAFHKAQVAYYVRMLEAVLNDLSIPASIDSFGEIWRIPDDGSAEGSEYCSDRFSLSPYLRMVDEFCVQKLPEILEKAANRNRNDTFFHIYFKCEQCKFLTDCKTSISEELEPGRRDVSAVPGFTHEAKRSIQRLGIKNVGQLAIADGLARQPGATWSLQRRAGALRDRANALINGVPLRSAEEHTYLMPSRVDVALFLVVDHDPVDDTLVTLGYSIMRNGQSKREIEVISSGDRAAEAEALVKILGRLLSDLTEIDAHNRQASSEDQLRAHIFFYESAEAVNLHRAVARHLDDPRIRGGLINIVRLFPPEEVVPEPEFRGAHHLPATIVRNVVEQLYALPVMVAYDLHQVSKALRHSGFVSVAYEPKDLFQRPFSALLALDISRALRERKMKGFSEADIEDDVFDRLVAVEHIVDWLFQEDEKLADKGAPRLLRLKKKPFIFHESFHPLDAEDLDILQALELLENRAGMLDCLIALAQTSNRRRDSGKCIAGMTLKTISDVSAKGPPRKRIVFEVPPDSRDSDLKPGDFDLILTDDDPDIRLDPSYWKGCGVSYWEPRENEWGDRVTLSMSKAQFDGDTFQRMLKRSEHNAVWHLDRCFFDVNSERAANFIRNLMQGSPA